MFSSAALLFSSAKVSLAPLSAVPSSDPSRRRCRLWMVQCLPKSRPSATAMNKTEELLKWPSQSSQSKNSPCLNYELRSMDDEADVATGAGGLASVLVPEIFDLSTDSPSRHKARPQASTKPLYQSKPHSLLLPWPTLFDALFGMLQPYIFVVRQETAPDSNGKTSRGQEPALEKPETRANPHCTWPCDPAPMSVGRSPRQARPVH